MQMKLLVITNVDFDVIGRLIRSSISVRYWTRSGSTMVQQGLHQLSEISRTPKIQSGEKCYTIFSLCLKYPEN
jgi:hypothetical protein